jgi:superfamily I DNA/RNA helicase
VGRNAGSFVFRDTRRCASTKRRGGRRAERRRPERHGSLGSLLTDMALEPPGDSVGDVLSASDEDEGLLMLSTIHSAKGLEWRAVFVIGLVDGRFPSYQNLRIRRRWRRSAASSK